jgi:hypothetical protein
VLTIAATLDDPIAVLLKFGFLLVLYLFLLWVARSALRELSGAGAAPIEDTGPTAEPRGDYGDLRPGVQPRLEVVAALGYEPGRSFSLDGELTLGRAPTSDVRVDDPFASAAHARIFQNGQFMYIEDMGSTNGTYLNGRQLATAQQLQPADTIRIGDSEYRYQE